MPNASTSSKQRLRTLRKTVEHFARSFQQDGHASSETVKELFEAAAVLESLEKTPDETTESQVMLYELLASARAELPDPDFVPEEDREIRLRRLRERIDAYLSVTDYMKLRSAVEPKATLGIKVIVDPSMPPDEIVMRGANGQRVRVTGLAIPDKASANTAICKTCCQEFELHDGHKCPGLAEKASEPWVCPKCQQLNSAGTTTCGRCDDL